MYEADIRMLDLRHTLPNVKNVLVMLSSPDPPPPGPVMGPGWASGAGSRASSRKPSANWAHQRSGSLVSLGSFPRRSISLSVSGNSPSLAAASIVSVGPTSESASDAGQGTGFMTPTPASSPPLWTSPQRSGLRTQVVPASRTEEDDVEDGDEADESGAQSDDEGSDTTEVEGYVVGTRAIKA